MSRRESAFVQVPVYLRKGGKLSKFNKIKGGIWVNVEWSLKQVRKSLQQDSEQFPWLPNEYTFFHPDTEVEISINNEQSTLWSEFDKSFIAIEGRGHNDKIVVRTSRKSRTESAASDVSVEANSLMFEMNSTFQDYPDKRAEFTQVLDAFANQEITGAELKWAVEQLCKNVEGGEKVLELFLEHLPEENYELIIDPSVCIETEENEEEFEKKVEKKVEEPLEEKSEVHIDNLDYFDFQDDPGAKEYYEKTSLLASTTRKTEKTKNKKKSKKKKSKSRSRSNSRTMRESTDVRRIVSDQPKDYKKNNKKHKRNSSSTLTRKSLHGGRPNSPPQDELDVEAARIRGQTLLYDNLCHGVVADVVSYTIQQSSVIFVVQVLAIDENGNAIERWTVPRVFSEFQSLHKNLLLHIKSIHRPLSSMADEHHMISRLSNLNTSKILLNERLKYLSSYLKNAILSVQAAAAVNHKIAGGIRAHSGTPLASSTNLNNAGDMYKVLAQFLSVKKKSNTFKLYGGDLCCECRQNCQCCRRCVSGSIFISILLFLPALSTIVNILYPASLGFDDSRTKNSIVSEVRVSWAVSAVRDCIAFIILLVVALFMEGCQNGCGRLLTAGWTSPASPLLHLMTAFFLSVLFVGWQTMFVLGTQYVMPPVTADSTGTSKTIFILPGAKHHIFVSSALGLVPLLYALLIFLFGGCGKYYSFVSTAVSNKVAKLSIVFGLVFISAVNLLNITTSFDLNLPCPANISANISKTQALRSPSSSSIHARFSSSCLYEGFIFLCCSSFCLALYIAFLSAHIYNHPSRTFRVFSTTAWTAGFSSIVSLVVLIVGSASVEGGISAIFSELPPSDDMMWYGVLPGVCCVIGSYLMIPWLILNTSGDVAACLYGIPLIYNVIACTVGFKWERKSTLPVNEWIYAGLSLLGVFSVLIVRMKYWCCHNSSLGVDEELNDRNRTLRTSLLGSQENGHLSKSGDGGERNYGTGSP
jgi:hypothetical protein